MKIVSLLPSATEIVCALGRQHDLVGISHSCDFPESVTDRAVLTSTAVPHDSDQVTIDTFVRQQLTAGKGLYELDIQVLGELAPDIIVTQTLCDVCAVSGGDVYRAVASLPHPPALLELDASSLDDVLDDITRTAAAINADEVGQQLVSSLRERAGAVASTPVLDGEKVLFLEWLDPPFTGGHWIPDMITLLGGQSCLASSGQRSRTAAPEEIMQCDPDIIVVACCGFDTERSRRAVRELENQHWWVSLRAVQKRRVIIGDGNAHFSRAGPRLIDGLEWLADQISGQRSTGPDSRQTG